MTIFDNVQTQRRALRELFGIERVACVYGWSMGALQAYHWAALFPDAVDRIVVNCGVARTAVHNQVFLRSLMATLEAAPEHIGDGRFSAEPRRGQACVRAHLCRRGRSVRISTAPACIWRPVRSPILARRIWRRSCAPTGRIASARARRQSVRAASHLGCRGHQRQPALRRRSAARIAGDPRARAADAGRDRPVFPRRRQRSRVAASGARGTEADPQHLGPSRRQSGDQPGRMRASSKHAVRDWLAR